MPVHSLSPQVAGLTTNGQEYFFILRSKTDPTCADTVKITRNERPDPAVLPTYTGNLTGLQAACLNQPYTLPAIPTGTNLAWENFSNGTSVPLPATVKPSGTITGLTTQGNYVFRLRDTVTGCVSGLLILGTFDCSKKSVCGKFWDDTNNNGRYDASEPLLAGIVVGAVATGINSGNPCFGVFRTDTTDAGGTYCFGLPEGKYFVRIKPSSLPAGMVIFTEDTFSWCTHQPQQRFQ